MTHLIVFCSIYFLVMIQCSAAISMTILEEECGPNEKNCFRFSFSNITELKKKMKNDTNLRKLLREHAKKMNQKIKNDKKCAGRFKTTTTTPSGTENGPPTTQSTVATTTVTPRSICVSNGWKWINGSCLYISNQSYTKVNYTEARSHCNQMDGRLATAGIRDGTIVKYLKSDDFEFRSQLGQIKYWVGLQFIDGVWKWSDNATYDENLTNWDKGNPQPEDEYCALIHGKKNLKTHDYPCCQEHQYICEKDI